MPIDEPSFAFNGLGPPLTAVRNVRDRRKWRIFVIHRYSGPPPRFDFRLAMAGTLRSWAMPECPSLDPLVKRPALLLDDPALAPVEIPQSPSFADRAEAYLWDVGHYRTTQGSPMAGFAEGLLSFTLRGRILGGVFHLVRIPQRPRHWVLLKVDDDFAISGWLPPGEAQC